MVTGHGKDHALAIPVDQWPWSSGTCPADLMLPGQCMTCQSLEKQRHHIFCIKKAQREVLKESWDTSWLLGGAGPGCHCMRQKVALANLPFVSGSLFPVCPMGKASMFPSHRGCWSCISKNTRCPGTVGMGTTWAPNLRWKHKVRHFQAEIIQVIFVISSSNILSAWEVEKHSSCPIQIHASSRHNFGLLN